MAQISYTNKVALNENPEIADINKVTDDDMNEIKQVVNDNYNNTIVISDTQPTSEDNKIWIDTGEVGESFTEITNEYSTSTGKGYSANYINNLHTYSTTEQRIGTWIDDKSLYRKVINIGNLPNAGTKNVALNITNLSQIINMYGYAIANDFTLPLPYISTSAEYQVGIQVSGSNLQIVTGFDRSAFAGYVVVEYTKTTD